MVMNLSIALACAGVASYMGWKHLHVPRGRLKHVAAHPPLLFTSSSTQRDIKLPPWCVSAAQVLGVVVAGIAISMTAAVLVAMYTAALRWAITRYRKKRQFRLHQTAYCQAITHIAADVRAGAEPNVALKLAFTELAKGTGLCTRNVVAAANLHHGIAEALERTSAPGSAARRLACVWRLADTGITIAPVLDNLEADLIHQQALAHTRLTETAGARATALLLLMLPLAGILFGYSMGMDPPSVLLFTTAGSLCAVIGAALQLVGAFWAYRITTHPEVKP